MGYCLPSSRSPSNSISSPGSRVIFSRVTMKMVLGSLVVFFTFVRMC